MATCKDCLHNDACVDMLQALGFTVDGDGYLADRRCRTFKNKNGHSEVVRCKDCKHSDVFDTLLYCEHTRGIAGSVSQDGFCYLGERRAAE